jgi:signal transduction histidine kinase
MTLAGTIAVMSVALACYVAALSRRFSLAPGWKDQRWFSAAALAVATYSALNVPTTFGLSDGLVVACSRAQIAAAAMHSAAWIRYSSVHLGTRTRLEHRLLVALAAIAALGALTPAVHPGETFTHRFEPLGLTYHSAQTSWFGDLALAFIIGTLAVPVIRFGRAWRNRVPHAGVQFAGLTFLVLMGTNDALAVAGVYAAPYLVDLGFIVPIAAVGYALTSRFVADARALDALRAELSRRVDERTAELTRTQEQLHRAEKLAALGQFAAGVAHEVNNPAAVVSANLGYIADCESDALSDDGRDAVRESVSSIQRISAIVRQLLDAGRLASDANTSRPVALRPVVDEAARAARARYGRRARISNRVDTEITAFGQEGVLAQVLGNLVMNAVQAIPENDCTGEVRVHAEAEGERVVVVVEDDGCGMEPDVLRRIFEPFFTTKPFGSGTGLGLAVSRGLVLGLGGDLRFESTPGAGTRAFLELRRAPPPGSADPGTPRRHRSGRRVLVIDDEGAIRSSLRRLLGAHCSVVIAEGVDAGLRLLDDDSFDLVLCDVMMPDGGGERLFRTLLARDPAAARKVVFITGGTVTANARDFLRAQPQPVLFKPFNVEELELAAARL